MFKNFLFTLLASIAIMACTAQSTPTLAPVDIQNTAMSAAQTTISGTLPYVDPTETITPLPPTETPSPTPLPITTTPTAEQLITPASPDPNICNKTLNVGEAGPLKNVRIENENRSQVNLSLNLYTPNQFGQCGYLSYVLKSGEKRKIEIPTGYWSAYSWVLDPPSQASKSFFIGPSGSDDLLRLVIKKDVIAWVGP